MTNNVTVLEFTVKVELKRTEGLFARRAELVELVREELEGADPGEIEGENGGQYEVTSWEVSAP